MPLKPLRSGLAALAVAAVCACSADAGGDSTGTAAPTTSRTSAAPECTPAPLAARAGMVLHVGLPDVVAADDPSIAEVVGELGVGGIFVNDGNIEDADQLVALTTALREAADGRPLLLSTDEESGRVSDFRTLLGDTPSPRRLAARRTPEQVREYAAELGRSLREYGIDLDLAPLLDLDEGPSRGIIGDRSFSADPELAATYGLAFSRGLADADVLPAVKHFPGHGRSTKDTHSGTELVEASLDELRDTDLAPFQAAVDAGAPVVMLNHLAYAELDPQLPASMAPEAYALLREMGFDGVAMTDSIGMGAIYPRWDFPEAAVRAISAGADVVLASGAVLRKDPEAARRMRDALVEAVESGQLPEERLNEAAARVVALAGGDPVEFACVDKTAPALDDGAASGATGTPTAVPTPTGG